MWMSVCECFFVVVCESGRVNVLLSPPCLSRLKTGSFFSEDGGHMGKWVRIYVCYVVLRWQKKSLSMHYKHRKLYFEHFVYGFFLKLFLSVVERYTNTASNRRMYTVVLYVDRLKRAVEFRSWNDYKDKDVFGTVSGAQIKSDFLIFGKQLSLIHTKCLHGINWEKPVGINVSKRFKHLVYCSVLTGYSLIFFVWSWCKCLFTKMLIWAFFSAYTHEAQDEACRLVSDYFLVQDWW